MFWVLDGYYLRQERLFRKLFDKVRADVTTNLSMDTTPVAGNVAPWLAVMWSSPLWIFYLTMAGAILAVILLDNP
jgi:hypothetical protein